MSWCLPDPAVIVACPLDELSQADPPATPTGLRIVRQAAGSHEIWWNPDNEQFSVIPRHGGRDLPTGTLRSILRQLGIEPSVFHQRRKDG